MKNLSLFQTVAGIRSYLASDRPRLRLGLVPTMGALHFGHSKLIEKAVAENDLVVVSIFINPLQFSPQEDFASYPRSLEEDCEFCENLGVNAIFAPTIKEMRADKVGHSISQVQPPDKMLSVLCAPFRPGHFQGVATIVIKLFNIIAPDVAYFGEKDAQQLAIIRRLVADLSLPIEIQACPIVRDASGLAFSSRNQYLSDPEKASAAGMYQSLKAAKILFQTGERQCSPLIETVEKRLSHYPEIKLQYAQLVDAKTLNPLQQIEQVGLLVIAAYLGSTRLIDNILLDQRQPIIAIDGPAGAGKSTITRRIAQELELLYLDTGAMYRAITWMIMKAGVPLDAEAKIAELVSKATLELTLTKDGSATQVLIDNEDVTDVIRTPEVTANVSQISAQKAVRHYLSQQQRCYGERGGLVAEGRDMGTQIFPEADLKIFLTASVQERAKRRLQDFKFQGVNNISLEQLQQDIQRRDERDSQRSIAPLRKAADAITLNTDNLSIEAVTNKIIQYYRLCIEHQRLA